MVLAVVISVVGCFTALNLLSRYDHTTGPVRRVWLVACGVIFGLGVWTTHFVAMLAYRPGIPVGYEVNTTLLSIAVSATGAVFAFALYRDPGTRLRTAFWAGPVLGGSVVAMHFVEWRRSGSMARYPST